MNTIFKIIFLIFLMNIVCSLLSCTLKEKEYTIHSIHYCNLNIPTIPFGNFTPKIIHQCWIGDLRWLSHFEDSIQNTKKYLTDYQHILWTEDMILTFIREKYSKRILNAYLSVNSGYEVVKADLFRYLVIYYYGGIYLDMKSSFRRDIDSFMKKYGDKLIVSHWIDYPLGSLPLHHFCDFYNAHLTKNSYGEFQNFYIASPPGNPLLKKVIQKVVCNIENGCQNEKLFCNGKSSVILLSGPILYTNVIQENFHPNYVHVVKKNMNSNIIYQYVNHKKMNGLEHYSKKKDKKVLKNILLI